MRIVVTAILVAVLGAVAVSYLDRLPARGPASAAGAPAAARSPASTPVERTVYKWRDEKGTVHFESAPPPEGTRHEVLRMRESPRAPAQEAPAASARGEGGIADNPLSVYLPGGAKELMERAAGTAQTLQRRRRDLEDLKKDL